MLIPRVFKDCPTKRKISIASLKVENSGLLCIIIYGQREMAFVKFFRLLIGIFLHLMHSGIRYGREGTRLSASIIGFVGV